MNQNTKTAKTTMASSVPRPTERMLSASDIPFLPGDRPPSLFQERLLGEFHRGVELVVGVGLLHEAVALVVGEDEPHRRAALLQRLDDLHRLRVRHARVVL